MFLERRRDHRHPVGARQTWAGSSSVRAEQIVRTRTAAEPSIFPPMVLVLLPT